ncbi:MAG TPA: hypothetical protein VFN11_19470 [Ktedonobacterales bacterium]|nr:hypothetical protein [Ktedonobacterales bacterium]
MNEQYYQTTLKPSERPYPTLKFAVMDGYSRVVALCEREDRAVLLVHALNNYVSGSEVSDGHDTDD